jgi:hypothetical protein
MIDMMTVTKHRTYTHLRRQIRLPGAIVKAMMMFLATPITIIIDHKHTRMNVGAPHGPRQKDAQTFHGLLPQSSSTWSVVEGLRVASDLYHHPTVRRPIASRDFVDLDLPFNPFRRPTLMMWATQGWLSIIWTTIHGDHRLSTTEAKLTGVGHPFWTASLLQMALRGFLMRWRQRRYVRGF